MKKLCAVCGVPSVLGVDSLTAKSAENCTQRAQRIKRRAQCSELIARDYLRLIDALLLHHGSRYPCRRALRRHGSHFPCFHSLRGTRSLHDCEIHDQSRLDGFHQSGEILHQPPQGLSIPSAVNRSPIRKGYKRSRCPAGMCSPRRTDPSTSLVPTSPDRTSRLRSISGPR